MTQNFDAFVVEDKKSPFSKRVIDAVVSVNTCNIAGIIGKTVARGLVPFEKIQTQCYSATHNDLCELASFESFPDAIQAFAATFGVAIGLARLFERSIDQKIVGLTALTMFSLILLGEAVGARFQVENLNVSDIVMETVGMLPALLILNNLARKQ